MDFHSLRHTFCTYLHRAGVPMREAMELMRHNDARLTMSIYADSSLFALRPAVEKLPWNYLQHDAQIHAQSLVPDGLLPSLPVTGVKGPESDRTPVNTMQKSLRCIAGHDESQLEGWCAIQGSNL